MAIKAAQTGPIVSRGLPVDLNYLNEGSATQLTGNYIDHTPVAPETQPAIPVSVDGASGALVLPDRPGEDWARLYTERRWPEEWQDYIAPTTSCLLLVRAIPPDGGTRDWLALQRFMGPGANFNIDADHSKDPAPIQVVLVDWIQLIAGLYRERLGAAFRPRIGIVITAWDDLDADARAAGPMEHLRNNHKLLYDFIVNNRDRMDLAVFGVTLYGGDLKDPVFSQSLVDSLDPRKNGWVTYEADGKVRTSPDLLTPIVWALSPTRRDDV